MALLNSQNNETQFNYSISQEHIVIYADSKSEECQFVIADREGFVHMKGRFLERKEIHINDLPLKEFELVIFNASNRCSFPIQIG